MIALFFWTTATAARATGTPRIDLSVNPENQRLYDGQGRERLFHGTNVVYKLPPYVPTLEGEFDAQFSLVDADLQLMADLGFNTIRVNVPWAAAEPTESGGFNETWFAAVETLLNNAGEHGIYAFLDMHQDAMSLEFCGTGFPAWAMHPDVPNFPVPLTKAPVPIDPALGYPNRTVCNSINNNDFPDYYFAAALSTATGALYNNTNGVLDRFAAFWGFVAQRLGATVPNVIGFELLNEPWAGDIYKNPLLLVPGVADRVWLQPMYDQLAASIRAHVPAALLLFQSVTWEVLGLGEALGFTHVPGGPQFQNRSVLAFHNSVAPGFTPDAKYYQLRLGEAQRLGCGLWVTETGDAQLDLLDEFGISWNQWDFKWFANWTWDNSGLWHTNGPFEPCADRHNMAACLIPSAAALYARTYPQAVAGRRLSFSFNHTTAVAVLVYEAIPAALPTEIFVSSRVYACGLSVAILPENSASWSQSGSNLLVSFMLTVPANVTVVVSPTSC